MIARCIIDGEKRTDKSKCKQANLIDRAEQLEHNGVYSVAVYT